jgi:hypothetical protein
MSIDIVIRQKGFFKKILPLSVILGDHLVGGTYDQHFRLEEGHVSPGGEMAVYDPAQKARGFTVTWSRKSATLRALNPTTTHELEDFYAAVERIMGYWNATLEVDGFKNVPLQTFLDGRSAMIQHNEQYLARFLEKTMDKKPLESVTLFSALWPLELGAKEAAEIRNAPEGIPARFAGWLHELQSADTYYAAVGYTEEADGIVGRFAFTEDCDSLFPVKPSVPFGVTSSDGQPFEVSRYEVAVFSTTTRSVIGKLPYDAFMTALSPNKVSYYDAKRVRIAPHSLAELKELIAKAGI